MRARWIILLASVLTILGIGAGTTAALATPPVTLTADHVLDQVGALTPAETASINADLSDLALSGNGALYIVFVDTFTDPIDAQQWADAVAMNNNLGPDQYLLAIATEGRAFYTSGDTAGPLSDAQLDSFEDSLIPALSASDWGGAAEQAASWFTGALTGAGTSGEAGSDGGTAPVTSSADSNPGIIVTVAFVGILIIAGIPLTIMAIARRKKQQNGGVIAGAGVPNANDPNATVSTEELGKKAGAALLAADNAITASKEELGFAVAQFGEEASATFTKTVTDAKAKVSQAFTLQQQVDDEIPDTEEQKRAWYAQILTLCDEADDLLDSNVEAFEELRKLEKDAPGALAQVKTRRAAAQATVDAAPAALAQFSSAYTAEALATVADNPNQAQSRLTLADNEIAEAEKHIAASENGEAALAIRTAEQAVQQAEHLAEAITGLGQAMTKLEAEAKKLIAEIEADVAAASQLPDQQRQVAAVIASTRTHVEQAKKDLAAASRNPQQVLDTLARANQEIDTVLGTARDAAQQAQRSASQLQQRIAQAQAQITMVNEFITSRRGAIGTTARTRLSEASAALQQALQLQSSDPTAALSFAERAYALAQQADREAQSEMSGWNSGGGGSILADAINGGGYVSNRRYYNDDDGGLLGGLLGGLFGGDGGGGGGGFFGGGGGGWRSSGGSSGFGGSSRSSSRSSSSFRSSSRSSSGGGGGRGRSGGGRF